MSEPSVEMVSFTLPLRMPLVFSSRRLSSACPSFFAYHLLQQFVSPNSPRFFDSLEDEFNRQTFQQTPVRLSVRCILSIIYIIGYEQGNKEDLDTEGTKLQYCVG